MVIAAILAPSLLLGGNAFAHARLIQATPAENAIVQKAPVELELHFSEGVEVKFCKVEIKGADGRVVPIQSLAGAPGDRKTLLARLQSPLRAGRYQVLWQVVSIDTHRTEGTYSFTIQP